MKYHYEQERWQRDTNTYRRYQDMLDKFTSEAGKRMVERSMEVLQDRWPNHKLG